MDITELKLRELIHRNLDIEMSNLGGFQYLNVYRLWTFYYSCGFTLLWKLGSDTR